MPEQANRMSIVIRTLRKDCGMTQVEFAAALHIAPASVHRWESGTSNPDFELAVSLWALANQYGSSTSKHFAEFLAGRVDAIKPLFAAAQAPIVQALDSALADLSPDHLHLVLALIEMLKNNKDKTSDQMLHFLLDPWKQKILTEKTSGGSKGHQKQPSSSRRSFGNRER